MGKGGGGLEGGEATDLGRGVAFPTARNRTGTAVRRQRERTWYISVSMGDTKLEAGRSSVAGTRLGTVDGILSVGEKDRRMGHATALEREVARDGWARWQ